LLSDNVLEQTFLVFVIGGMSAGALVSLAYHLPTYIAYVFSAVMPLSVIFVLEGRTVHVTMGGMLVVFIAALTFAAHHFNSAFVRGLRLNSISASGRRSSRNGRRSSRSGRRS